MAAVSTATAAILLFMSISIERRPTRPNRDRTQGVRGTARFLNYRSVRFRPSWRVGSRARSAGQLWRGSGHWVEGRLRLWVNLLSASPGAVVATYAAGMNCIIDFAKRSTDIARAQTLAAQLRNNIWVDGVRFGVNRVVLTIDQPRPVYPDQRTSLLPLEGRSPPSGATTAPSTAQIEWRQLGRVTCEL